ncbi:MAG: AtpZ/AtpI family protein [Polyangiaceae bacterium]|nr:AtpZ/AtpI family protein [Polyangiaceae bacterium]
MKNRLEMYKGLGGFGTLGMEIVLSILLGLFAGRWIDGRYGTDPWFTMGGFAFGIALSVHATMRALRSMRAEAAREEREEGNPTPLYETESDRAARIAEERKQREQEGTS